MQDSSNFKISPDGLSAENEIAGQTAPLCQNATQSSAALILRINHFEFGIDVAQ
jgi:hypothetical protein